MKASEAVAAVKAEKEKPEPKWTPPDWYPEYLAEMGVCTQSVTTSQLSENQRAVDMQVVNIVGEALHQHYVIKPCENCGGPEIFSKEQPAAKCVNCGRLRQTYAVMDASRHKCTSCGKFFNSVTAWNRCPDCRASDERRKKAAQQRERRARKRKAAAA